MKRGFAWGAISTHSGASLFVNAPFTCSKPFRPSRVVSKGPEPVEGPLSRITDAIDGADAIVRDEQGAVGHFQRVNGPSPEPALGENFIGRAAGVFQRDARDQVADGGRAIQGAMLGNENAPLYLAANWPTR